MALVPNVADSDLAKFKTSILETFKRYDTNGDGIISRDEMWALLRVLDKAGRLQYDGIDSMLSALDRNGDGLVDTEEFVEWVMGSDSASTLQQGPENLASLDDVIATHTFVLPQDEANLERCTVWKVRREENIRILANLGLGELDDPELLLLSVGSSSTQAYDARDLAVAFPCGTKVCSAEVYKDLTATLTQRRVSYRRVLLLNSIGYQLSVSDPSVVPLSDLASRVADKKAGVPATTADLHAALKAALPEATMYVLNRAKDQATKRYRYPQVVNDFTEALVSGHGLRLCSHGSALAEQVPDAIVDWGGGSFKVYVNGKRVGTQLMDANTRLCEGGVLNRGRLSEAMQEIKLFVLRLLPEVRRIFIAQTGKARELAMREVKPVIGAGSGAG